MRITSPVSLEAAEHILRSYEETSLVLGDTEVEVYRDSTDERSNFLVKRCGRAKVGIKYTMWKVDGTITKVADQQVVVNAQLRPGIGLFASIGIYIFILLLYSTKFTTTGLLLAIGLFLLVNLPDLIIMYRLAKSLERGISRSVT